jgi:uncharacterized membrane protein YphA (DoxX/SURF4 family)
MSDSSCSSTNRWDLALANLLLRLWIGLRLVFAGLDKFRAGSGADATFNMENYEKKMAAIAKLTYNNGFLPENLCNLYAKPLGFLLLIAGVWAVIGLFSRLGLFFAGLVFLSLGVGLATLPDDTEVLYIGVHILIVAAALATNQHSMFSLDGLFFGKKKRELPPVDSAA